MFEYPDFFNDVFGPIMQPFSSSHTAAPCRIGYLANSLLNEPVKNIKALIDPEGSFASSMKMMNVDLALLSGSTGHLPDNKILFEIESYCKNNKIEYEIVFEKLKESNHHSAAKLMLEGINSGEVELVANSLGGGKVETVMVNGFPFRSNGDAYVLFIIDKTNKLGPPKNLDLIKMKYQILEEGIVESEENGTLLWVKSPDEIMIKEIENDFKDYQLHVMKPIQPVITKKDKKPQLFDSFEKWVQIAKEQGKTLYETAVQYEMDSSCWSRDKVLNYMKDVVAKKMHRTTHAAFEEGVTPEETPFTGHHYKQWTEYATKDKGFVDGTIKDALGYAFAAQAPIAGVEFVPGPMGAGGGLIYSALYSVKKKMKYKDEDMVRGLFIAAAVGAICFSKTQPSGVTIGCAGEQGICMAMAAAAICEMSGGTPEQIEAAASFSLQISVGWPCDPVPGCKNQPCYSRAASTVAMAIVFAQLALSGRDAVFPFDEVVEVADRVGRNLPEDQRGTSKGGHGSAPTAKKNMELFAQWNKERLE